MLRVAISVALAMSVLGCNGGSASAPSASPSGPVPLLTVETQTSFGSCVLDLYYVADLIADPKSDAPTDAATGKSFAWPKGFTARRAGSEVEVLDPAGNVVLMTGQRYRMCPAPDDTREGSGLSAHSSGGAWVIGEVDECMVASWEATVTRLITPTALPIRPTRGARPTSSKGRPRRRHSRNYDNPRPAGP